MACFHGFSHGDIKIENCLVQRNKSSDGIVGVLSDWGGAKNFDHQINGKTFYDAFFSEPEEQLEEKIGNFFIRTPLYYDYLEFEQTKKILFLAQYAQEESARKNLIDIIAGREFLRDQFSLGEVLFQILCPEGLVFYTFSNRCIHVQESFLSIYHLRKKQMNFAKSQIWTNSFKKKLSSIKNSSDEIKLKEYLELVEILKKYIDAKLPYYPILEEISLLLIQDDQNKINLELSEEKFTQLLNQIQELLDKRSIDLQRRFRDYSIFLRESFRCLLEMYSTDNNLIHLVQALLEPDLQKRSPLYSLCCDYFGKEYLKHHFYENSSLYAHLSEEEKEDEWNKKMILISKRISIAQQDI